MGVKLPNSQSSDVNESSPSFHRYCGHLGSFLENNTVLIVTPIIILVEGRLFSDTCMSFTEHLSIGLIVFVQARGATGEPTDEVVWVILGTRVCYRAWSLDGLPTCRSGTQRTVRFVVVVGTVRSAVVDIECLVGEWFL